MKEIKAIESAKVCNGEIEVKPYLTYAEIQSICDAVCKFDSWAERQQNVDILLMHFATSITDEEIQEIGHEALIQSGIIDEVKQIVKNFDRIEEAVEYTQSTQRALAQILKELPVIMDPLKKVLNCASKPSKQ